MQQPKPLDPSFWGQAIMVGLPGPSLDAAARELVRDRNVGGIILFARNIETPEQVWELTRDLQAEARAAGLPPLLIAVDQEGGTVQRLKAPFTLIPPAQELGESASPAAVETLARKVGRELALVGINVNFAPVLDVARSAACPLWGRAYSREPEQVAEYALAAIKGYLAGGVIPVAKHFPGLGDTLVDSHLVLPRAQSPDPMRQADLLPFRRAVAAGVPAVMTAHLEVPAWDARPVTLSPVALQQWLRRELGFAGVIITDDLEMGAIAAEMSVPAGAAAALAAGADLLLICKDWQAAGTTARELARRSELSARGQEAVARVNCLRQTVPPRPAKLQEVRQYFAASVKA